MAEVKKIDIGTVIALRKAIFALERLKDCDGRDCPICPLAVICRSILEIKDELKWIGG